MEPSEWSRKQVLILIAAFKQMPQLYDPSHPFYTRKPKRISSYHEITKRLQNVRPGTTVDEVKVKLINLRCQFAHTVAKLRKRNLEWGAGENSNAEPSLWWYPHYIFMKPFIKPRKSFMREAADAVETIYVSDPEDSVPVKTERREDSPVDFENSATTSTSESDDYSYAPQDSVHMAIQELTKIATILEKKLVSQPIRDDVSAFVNYIVSELAKIKDEEILADVKHKILNVLYEARKQEMAFDE